MINWIKSAELNGMSIVDLKSYFDKFPNSVKRICRICNNCKEDKWICLSDYTDLCNKCKNLPPKPKFVTEKDRFILNTNIDRIITIEKMGYDPIDLKSNSNRKVWRICEDCKEGKLVNRSQAHDRCHKCALRTEKVRKNMSKGAKTRLPTSDEARLNMSIFQKKRYEDPEEIQKKREITIKLWEDPEYRKKQKHSPDQLCRHHVAYDFNDPDALVVIVTRRRHGQIHHPKGIGIHQRGYSLID